MHSCRQAKEEREEEYRPMSEISPTTFPKYRPHPILASLPPYLKDHKNYEKIQKFIIESLASKHSHGEMMEWATCAACQKRFAERGAILKELGFKHPSQYMAWRKIHEHIKARVPLPKYNT